MSARVRGGSRSAVERHDDGAAQLVRWWEPRPEPVATLVIVHGYGEHSGRYEAVGEHLAEAGIAAWAMDLPGHGRSDGERASLPHLAGAVEAAGRVVRRARDARALPLFVLGHSMGGLVATALVLERQHEVAGLVLSGPAVGDPAGIEPLLDLEPLPEVVLDSALLSRDPRVAADYDSDPLNYRGPFPRETLRFLVDGAHAVRARFAELRLPLLILHGAEDALVPAQGSRDLAEAAASQDRELTVYPGLRHEILNEPEGAEIAARIAAWVRQRA